LGDPSKARKQLDWHPAVNFLSLVKMMVQYDLDNPHSNI
jgi:GDP-D-mannose dehydratase